MRKLWPEMGGVLPVSSIPKRDRASTNGVHTFPRTPSQNSRLTTSEWVPLASDMNWRRIMLLCVPVIIAVLAVSRVISGRLHTAQRKGSI